MGVRGLMTYINKRSEKYLENYQLHDCNLVIDGNSLVKQIYNWRWTYWGSGYSNACYGGDYDKYAHNVKSFFALLKKCNVTPFVILNGGYNEYKLAGLVSRMENRIKNFSEVTPDTVREIMSGTKYVELYTEENPLCRKCTLREVLQDLGVKVSVSQFESGREIACVAKHLDCPVLSFNSDFFLFGCKYIPFNTVDHKGPNYIPCKLYKITNLLKDLGRIDKNMLYLLPLLSSNDDSEQDLFDRFLSRIDIRGFPQQKLNLFFKWLRRNRNFKNTIEYILDCFTDKKHKIFILNTIKRSVSKYMLTDVTILPTHFGIAERNELAEQKFDFKIFEQRCYDHDSASENIDSDKTFIASEVFSQNFRKNQYPSCFMDMLLYNIYHPLPQVGNQNKPSSHILSFDILSAIFKILVNDDNKKLTVMAGNEKGEVERFVLDTCTKEVPSVEDIENLRKEPKIEILLDVLDLGYAFREVLDYFPEECHLPFLCLKYCVNRETFEKPLMYSVILCFLILNYVDPKLNGFFRTGRDLRNRSSNTQRVADEEDNATAKGSKHPLSQCLEKDCLIFMQKIVRYFEMDPQENSISFDRNLVHSMCQIQSVILHVNFLNALLKFPFDNAIHKFFDGTFIYNMTKKLRKIHDIKDYLRCYLEDCPSILANFIYIIDLMGKHFL